MEMRLQQMSPILLLLPTLVWGHGAMIVPPSRNVMHDFGFPDVPKDYEWNGVRCGGPNFQFGEAAEGRCGVCGDRWDAEAPQFEAPGEFATGTIGRTYRPGAEIDVIVWITKNHKGFFTFRLCKQDNVNQAPDQSCFEQEESLLQVKPSVQEPWQERYIVTSEMGDNKNMTMKLRLPDWTCQQCILQWTYQAGNNWDSCKEGQERNVGCSVSCEVAYTGTAGECKECVLGKGAKGCGPQEHFRNCADIAINTDVSPSPSPTDTPVIPCDGGDSCCTTDNPCVKNHGDCDADHHCMKGLVCGHNNCIGPNFDPSDDCCQDPDPDLETTTKGSSDPETTTQGSDDPDPTTLAPPTPTTCPVCKNTLPTTPIDCNCNCNCNCK